MTEQRNGRAAKLLMPVVATLASALASYLAKKGPELLEQAVLPKVREANPTTAAAETAEPDELEQRRRERAEHRAARRKAS